MKNEIIIDPEMIQEITLCENWISLQKKTQRINNNRSSYGYKHDVERWTEKNGNRSYISNDSFKAAARNMGLKVGDSGAKNEHYNLKII